MSEANLPDSPIMSPRHLWQFIFRPKIYYSWLQATFGKVVKLRFPHTHLVMTLTAEGAQEILTGHPQNYEAFQREAFHGIFGDGSIFNMEGEQHHQERQLLMPSFQKQTVHHYAPAIRKIIDDHTQTWQQGQELGAQEAMLAISRDVIMMVVFGRDFDRVKEEGRRRLAQMLAVEHPWIFFVPQTQSWWSPYWRRYRRVKRQLFAFCAQALAERRANGRVEKDVLGRLIAARDEAGAPKSDADILDELYSILLPGHATTGVAMGWALYELSRHPEILAKLREELDGLGPKADPAQLVKLPYLDAVCKESMRLHTIVTETARRLKTPQELLSYAIPAGYGIGVGMFAVHHDPELYADPDSFRPERFLERDYSPFEFLPFGGGHRRCLGAALSDFEMRLTVASLVSRWDFDSLQEEQEQRHNLGVGSRYGMRLRISQREPK